MTRSQNINQLGSCNVLGGNHKFWYPSIRWLHILLEHRGIRRKHYQNNIHQRNWHLGPQHKCKSKSQRRRLSKQPHYCSQEESICICRTHYPNRSCQRITMGSKCTRKWSHPNGGPMHISDACRCSHSFLSSPNQFSSMNS